MRMAAVLAVLLVVGCGSGEASGVDGAWSIALNLPGVTPCSGTMALRSAPSNAPPARDISGTWTCSPTGGLLDGAVNREAIVLFLFVGAASPSDPAATSYPVIGTTDGDTITATGGASGDGRFSAAKN